MNRELARIASRLDRIEAVAESLTSSRRFAADEFDEKFPRVQGYAGFTDQIRSLHEAGLAIEKLKAEVEATFPGLFEQLANLEKEQDKAGKAFKATIPKDITDQLEKQGQFIISTTTKLVTVDAAIRSSKRKGTLDEKMLSERIMEKYSKEIADDVSNMISAIKDEKSTIVLALRAARSIDRDGTISDMRTAGILDTLKRALDWVKKFAMKVLSTMQMGTKVIEASSKSVQSNSDKILKSLR